MGIITKRNGKILMILGMLLIVTGFFGSMMLYSMFGEYMAMPRIFMSLDAIFILSFVIIGPMLTVIGIPVFIVSSRRIPSKLMDVLKTGADTRTKISFLARRLGINEKDVISTIVKLRSKGEPVLISHSTSEVIYSPTLPPPTAPPLPMRAGVDMEAKTLEKPFSTPMPPPSPAPLDERVAMGKCPECGEEVWEDESFCHSCGAKLVEAPPPAIPEAVLMDATLLKALENHLSNLHSNMIEQNIGEPAISTMMSRWDKLMRPDVLTFTIGAIKQQLGQSLEDLQHHYKTKKFEDIYICVSTVPFVDHSRVMSLFQGGYPAFLTSIINDAGFVSGDFDLAHWIFGYDRKSNLHVVHLTFLPPSKLAGIITLAHELMTAEEKKMSWLPAYQARQIIRTRAHRGPVCDVCNKKMTFEDGYVLSTTQVATSEAYWKFAFTHQWSHRVSMDPEGDTLAMLAQNQAAQLTGWLLCESCIQLFNVDRKIAKEYATIAGSSSHPGDYSPPGGGPANPEAVALAAAKAWKKLHGKYPRSIRL